MAELSLQHVDKIYDNNVQAVFDFNLEVKDKEFIVFVGPSGCGKSTLLKSLNRMNDLVEGCRITGRVELDGEDIYGDMDVIPGIRLIALPGHSPGSQGVLVDTEKGQYLIAGDCIGSYDCWTAPGHIVGAVHSSISEYLDTYKKMDQMDCQILPGHDGKVLEHDVYPF